MTKRILVVEDQEDNRQILEDLLSSVGFETIHVAAGAAAVAAAERERPDLILMDIQLPIMDGYEATRRIRRTPRAPRSRSSQSPPTHYPATRRRPLPPAATAT